MHTSALCAKETDGPSKSASSEGLAQNKHQPKGLRDYIEFWRFWLTNYPDKDFVSTIDQYLTQGMDIGFKGPRETLKSPNWPSSSTHQVAVQAFIQDNIALGAVSAP